MDSLLLKDKFHDSYTRSSFYINGDWVKPDTKNKIRIISPSTQNVIGEVPDANTNDIN